MDDLQRFRLSLLCPDVLHFPQDPLIRLSHIPWVTEADLSREVTIRRATPAFAYRSGGPVTRGFLDVAMNAGFVHHNSIVMAQVSPFVFGAGSTPPYWHPDYLQGYGPPETDRRSFWTAANFHTGVIMCAFETAQHPDDQGTIFLEGQDVTIPLALRDPDREYVPKQNTTRSITSGELYWYHRFVQRQVDAPCGLKPAPLRPNSVYFYRGTALHQVPVMKSDWGRRVVVRVNTPNDPRAMPPIENMVFGAAPEPVYVFLMVGPEQWVRLRIVA